MITEYFAKIKQSRNWHQEGMEGWKVVLIIEREGNDKYVWVLCNKSTFRKQ